MTKHKLCVFGSCFRTLAVILVSVLLSACFLLLLLFCFVFLYTHFGFTKLAMAFPAPIQALRTAWWVATTPPTPGGWRCVSTACGAQCAAATGTAGMRESCARVRVSRMATSSRCPAGSPGRPVPCGRPTCGAGARRAN